MKVLIPIADGFEEIEVTTTVDILRRADIDAVTAGIPGKMLKGARGMTILADTKLEDVNADEFDAIALPGGPGHTKLAKSGKVIETLHSFNEKKKLIAAICASPSILAKEGILGDRRATIYPGMEKQLQRPRDERVVVDENIITSQGPGTTVEFALKIVETLAGRDKANDVRREIVC
jgi:4-methyl-5(b-hydroxyethyl)-thiazole monophosphate biosynthesis